MKFVLTRQQLNAQRQRAEIRTRVANTCSVIRAEVKKSYDPKTGRCRYPHNKGRLGEAEFLRRAEIDKNTIKRDYHEQSRRMVARLIDWVNDKSSAGRDEPVTSPAPKVSSQIERMRQELDDLAENYALLQLRLSETLEANRALRLEAKRKDEEISKLTDHVVELKALVVNLRPVVRSDVVPVVSWHGTRVGGSGGSE